MTRPAPGYFNFGEYWSSPAGEKGRPFLRNMSAWDYGVSDADFCDEGGHGPTWFINSQNTQGRPSGFEGKGASFIQVNVVDGNKFEFLESFFP